LVCDRRSTSSPAESRPFPRAFTLVELLVVIGIIALLISILMPALSKAREQANAVKCMSNQRNLGNALVMFTQDHKGFLPKAWFNDGPVGSAISGKMTWEFRFPKYGWDYLLLGYVGKNRDLFRCPSDDPGRFRGDPSDATPETDYIPASYRMNISNQHVSDGRPDNPIDRPLYSTRISRLKQSSKAIVFFDGANNAALWHHAATWEISPDGLVTKAYRLNVGWKKHRGRANYTFADGHAESLLWEDTWQFVETDEGMWHQFPNK
jgi:prepilin-type processing-associated H-X9-DG protein/prepilin-type N-terminal cleavage/methylation domain-containing protein